MKHFNLSTQKQKQRWRESGNAIVMLFAAVGMAGVITYGLNNVMRGPGVMTAEISRKTIAENNLVASTRLAISAATNSQTNNGDCDSDGFVEPVPFRAAGPAPAPVGGGLLPMTIGASMSDPWGTQYGYCVWDAGTVKTSDDHAGCGGNTANRLDGGPKDNQPAIAVISAGKNGVFETSCNAYDDTADSNGIPDVSMVDRPAGSDDVVLSYTYAEANGIGGGEWKLKDVDDTTAESGKNLEIGGSGTFSGPVALTQKGLVLPGDPGDGSITGICDAAKDQQLRRNTSTAPATLEICDFGGAGWTAISGGSGSTPADEYFNSDGSNCTANQGGPLAQVASIALADRGRKIWTDDYYIYVAEWSGNLGIYTFNGAAFTRVGELDGPTADTISAVKGDGTYIYVGNGSTQRLEAWYFNGTTGIFIDDVATGEFVENVWADGTYVYVGSPTSLRGYTFDGTDLTLRDTKAASSFGLWGDGTYIYASGTNQLSAYTFNGTALTLAGTTATGGDQSESLWGDENFIYVALDTRLAAFTFNGTAFTQVGSNAAIDATGVWSDGVNVFASTLVGSYATTFDGSVFTVDSTLASTHDDAPQIRGDGNFIYTFTGTTGAYNLVALSGYRCTSPPPRNVITAPIETLEVAALEDSLDVGLLAYWPMNDGTGTTVEDVVGNYDGTFLNTPVWNIGPNGDGSLSFDKDDRDAVRITGLMGNQAVGTVGMWVNLNRYDSAGASDFFSIGDRIGLTTEGKSASMFFYNPTLSFIHSYKAIDGTGWRYLVGTWDNPGNMFRFYIDGVLQGSSTAAGDVIWTGGGANTEIGRDPQGSTYDFDGGIDDVRMYSRALSPAEVAMLYKKVKKNSIVRDLSAAAHSNNFFRNLLTVGYDSACAIKTDGTPWCWGDDSTEHLGNGTGTTDQTAPTAVLIPTAQTYYVSNTNSDILPASNLYSKALSTAPVSTGTSAVALATGAINNGYSITPAGIYGKDDGGGLRAYSVTMSSTVAAATACMRARVYAGRINAAGTLQGSEAQLGSGALLTAATTTFTGNADLGVFAATDRLRIRYNMYNTCSGSQTPTINFGASSTVTVPALEYPAWTQISSYNGSTCGLRADGTAWCWGTEVAGELGNGTILTAPQPVPSPVINTGARWTKITSGLNHACGIKEDGTLWCWGADTSGQIGDGATVGPQATPVQVGAATDWQSVAAGYLYTCGIRAGGVGYCWGEDGDGQLGNDTATTDQVSPALVVGGPWSSIIPRTTHTCGVKTDGTLWCWGDDTTEQLGEYFSSADQREPKQVPYPGPWAFAAPGDEHTCALKADSTVWCWGRYLNNRLGYAASANTPIPAMVPGSQGTVALESGTLGSCLMKADRSVWCWGSDSQGQIGNGAVTTVDQLSPTAVTGFLGKPGWTWNDAATLIQPPLGANVALNGNYLSPDTNTQGLGFASSGKASIRQMTDANQLLLETTVAGASAQMSFGNNANVAPPADYLTSIAGRWEFNDGAGTTAADTSGNGNTFTLGSGAGSRPAWAAGAIDGALDFDGTDDFLTSVNSASLNIATTVTLMAWVKLDTIDASFKTIVGKMSTNMSNAQYRMGIYDDVLVFDFCSSASAACGTYNGSYIDSSLKALEAGKWHHLAIVFNNTTNNVDMYIDGVKYPHIDDEGNTSTANMRTTTQPLYAGYGIDGDPFFDGQIDEIRIYNAPLTDTQIAQIYNFTLGTTSGPKAYTMGIDHANNNFEIGRNELDASNWLNAIDPDIAITSAGRVGVGTAAPAVKMEVAGGVKFGAESLCGAGRDGGIRYNNGSYQYCDGATWQPLGGGGGGGGGPAGADCSGLGDGSYNDPITGHCYFYKNQNSWFDDAVAACVADGAYLAVPNEPAEDAIIDTLVGNTDYWWIGLDDKAVEGDWKYSYGEKAGISFWSGTAGGSPVGGQHNAWNAGDPDNGGNSDCAIFGGGATVWFDVSCGTAYPYVCEKGPPPAPAVPWRTSRLPSFHQIGGAGWGSSASIRADGTAWTWGISDSGVLGNNQNVTYESAPIPIHSDSSDTGWTDWVSISPRIDDVDTNCGLRANGTAWCWGEATGGTLGNGSLAGEASRPVQVLGAGSTAPYTDWIQISGRCGVRANGTAYCWGKGTNGSVGNGASSNQQAPELVSGGYTDWLMVGSSGGMNCGLRANGTMWCWGRGVGGGLGNGTTVNSNVPVQVHSDTNPYTPWSDWIFVDTGVDNQSDAHACGIRADHSLWCWGNNGACQLGDNCGPDATRPIAVHSDANPYTPWTDWVSVSTGANSSCGIRVNGTLWCWGENGYRQLGDGTSTDRGRPSQVRDTAGTGYWNDWVSVSTSQYHTCGIRVNGEQYCWGNAEYGRMGNGIETNTNFPTPQLVQ